MRAALKSHSQDTGTLHLKPQVQAPSYTHVEAVLRYCDSHPAASAASQRSALLSPLSPAHKQVLRTLSACLQTQQKAAGSVLCRLPKCEAQAALLEGYPIPNNMPDAILLTRTSSQLQFSSRAKRGKGMGMRQYLCGY